MADNNDPKYMKAQAAVDMVMKQVEELVKDDDDLKKLSATLTQNLSKAKKTYYKDLQKDLVQKDAYKKKGDLQVEFNEARAKNIAQTIVGELNRADDLQLENQRYAFEEITDGIGHFLAFKKGDDAVKVNKADIDEKHLNTAVRNFAAPAEAEIVGKKQFIVDLSDEIRNFAKLSNEAGRKELAEIIESGVDGRLSVGGLLEQINEDFKIKENDLVGIRELADTTMNAKKNKHKFSPEIDTKIAVAAAMVTHGIAADKKQEALNAIKEAVKDEVKTLENFSKLEDEGFNKKFDKDFKSVAESKSVKNLPKPKTQGGNFATRTINNNPKTTTFLAVVVGALSFGWLAKKLFGKKKDAQALDDGQQPEEEKSNKWQNYVKTGLAVAGAAASVYAGVKVYNKVKDSGWTRG